MQGVSWMKTLKTYNMDVDVVQMLRNAPNKSQTVNRAVRRWYKNKEQFNVLDVDSQTLCGVLQSRFYDHPQIGNVLLALRDLINKNQE